MDDEERESKSIESQNIISVISFRLHPPRFNIVYFRLRSRLYQNLFITYIDVGNISETGVTLMRVEHGTRDTSPDVTHDPPLPRYGHGPGR